MWLYEWLNYVQPCENVACFGSCEMASVPVRTTIGYSEHVYHQLGGTHKAVERGSNPIMEVCERAESKVYPSLMYNSIFD